jgi:plasmid stabilization system protein ParE
VEATAYIAGDSPAAARRLREEGVAAAIRIGQYPLIGFVRPTLAPESLRFLVVTGFPYVIVYRSTVTPPRILRVLHGARDLPDALHGVSAER